MTISPYDSLPSGNRVEYTEVDLNQLKTTPAKTSLPPKPTKTKPLAKPPSYAESTFKNYLGCVEYILPFEETLLVPDTMPDMKEVLFAEGRVDISPMGKSTYDRNDFLSGNITVFTVYKPTDVVKSAIPFKTDKCWEHASGDTFRVAVSLKWIAAEMINERKFIVKGELLIKIYELAEYKLKHLSNSAENDIMTCRQAIQATVLKQELSDTTEISQDITIKEGQPHPVKILNATMNIVENHRQITSGKLILNASIHHQVLYVGEKDSGEHELCCTTGKTDFSQFIMINDDADTNMLKLTFRHDLDMTIENYNSFQLRGNVMILVQSYDNAPLESTCDAYHKKEDLLYDLHETTLSHVAGVVDGEISSREVIDLSENDKKPSVLLCGSCRIESLNAVFKQGQILITGDVKSEVLALDDEDSPFIINHTIPVRGTLEITAHELSDPDICVDVVIKDFWFGEINARQIELNSSLSITVWASTKEIFCTLENLRFADTDKLADIPSMAVYVVAPGERLWDVAKRYKCDIATLAKQNDLDIDTPLPAGAKIFFQNHV